MNDEKHENNMDIETELASVYEKVEILNRELDRARLEIQKKEKELKEKNKRISELRAKAGKFHI